MSRYPNHNRNAPLKSSKASNGKSGDNQHPIDLPQLLPIQKTLLEEANRKLRVRSDGKDQEITAGEAVLKKAGANCTRWFDPCPKPIIARPERSLSH